MQIFKSDHELITHVKTLFKIFQRKIIQQTKHIDSLIKLYMKNEHKRFKTNLFNYRVLSIYLLRVDIICIQQKS